MSTQKIKARRARQTLPRTRRAPEKLGKLIDLVNLLPLDISDQSLRVSKMELDQAMWPDVGNWPKQMAALASALTPIIAELPAPIRNFIGPIQPDTAWEAKEKYGLLIEARSILRIIASLSKDSRSAPIRDTSIPIALRVDEHGWIKIENNLLIEALTEQVKRKGKKQEGIAVARIRKCPICQRIYWAGRLDKPSCSNQCGQTYRVREWRKNKSKPLYKAARVSKASKR